MGLKVTALEIPEVLIIEPDVFGDHRGSFSETYSARAFAENGITNDFVQDNQSFSAAKGTLRGLHFQKDPMAQAKLLRCLKGSIFDVAVDVRKGSPTYGKWVGEIISAANRKQILIPRGFAHGFVTLEPDCEILYKVDQYYDPTTDRSIAWNDPEIGIDWGGITDPTVSAKDADAPLLKDSDVNFTYDPK